LPTGVETSPLGAAALSLHPAAFALVILVYLAVVVALVLRLGQPWNRALALSVVVGHTAGIYGWFVIRNYWYAIPTFLLVGIMTVLSWQRAERPP
jgi:hypothetical protein